MKVDELSLPEIGSGYSDDGLEADDTVPDAGTSTGAIDEIASVSEMPTAPPSRITKPHQLRRFGAFAHGHIDRVREMQAGEINIRGNLATRALMRVNVVRRAASQALYVTTDGVIREMRRYRESGDSAASQP